MVRDRLYDINRRTAIDLIVYTRAEYAMLERLDSLSPTGNGGVHLLPGTSEPSHLLGLPFLDHYRSLPQGFGSSSGSDDSLT